MIDARALHGWLGLKEQFNQWVRRRIDDYGFEENEDFWCSLTKTAGRPRTDYLLTLDMAKELAMVERTEVGCETRRYFIRMERAAVNMAATLDRQGQRLARGRVARIIPDGPISQDSRTGERPHRGRIALP